MAQTQQLHRLLLAGFNHKDFYLYSKDIASQFGPVSKVAIDKGFLIKNYAQRYPCSECGATHHAELISERFFIKCDTDMEAGLYEVKKTDLLTYPFSTTRLAEWLNSQLNLPETVEQTNENFWYLGILQRQGKSRGIVLELY